jgi:phosphomannomutase
MVSFGTGDFFGPEFDERRLSLKTHDDYVRLFGERAPTHPPGTEPLARIMVEGQDAGRVNEMAKELADRLRRCLGSAD